MSILDDILRDKQEEVNHTLSHIVKANLLPNSEDSRIPRNFKTALQADGLSIISEVKKASPSKGLIRADFHPVEIAKSYDKNGANCISVLTEEKYFQGHPDYLKAIVKEVSIPVLRKDFVVDERQIRDSYDLGADAILLIVAALSKQQLLDYYSIAKAFKLTALVEVHSEEELQTALEIQADLIGINNRNLKTFETNLNHSIELRKQIPAHVTCVSESGIHTTDDCHLLVKNGFDAILVGESLMRKEDPGLAISELLGR